MFFKPIFIDERVMVFNNVANLFYYVRAIFIDDVI